MQYTIRNIPKAVDRALRAKAKAERKSLNRATVDALGRALGVTGGDGRNGTRRLRDLSFMHARPMTKRDVRAFEDAREFAERVDEDAWR
jgi:plasmid stability protein